MIVIIGSIIVSLIIIGTYLLGKGIKKDFNKRLSELKNINKKIESNKKSILENFNNFLIEKYEKNPEIFIKFGGGTLGALIIILLGFIIFRNLMSSISESYNVTGLFGTNTISINLFLVVFSILIVIVNSIILRCFE